MSELVHSDPVRRHVDPPDLCEYRSAIEIIDVLRDAGFEAYLVGGCVRDLVLGVMPKDFDIVTSAEPRETRKLFRRTIPVGIEFGVLSVLHEGAAFEVATFRADGSYSDGRRPDWVRFTDVREDVARRDFTINGLLYDPATHDVIDYTGGLDDLGSGIIRTIGDPAMRFTEDALRLVRAIRFAARLGFHLEDTTRESIAERAETITLVAQERVWTELDLMLVNQNRAHAVELLRQTRLMEFILPDVNGLDDDAQNPLTTRLHALPDECPVEITWAVLLADVFARSDSCGDDRDGPLCDNLSSPLNKLFSHMRAPKRVTRGVEAILSRRWTPSAESLREGSLLRILRHDPEGHLPIFWSADAHSRGDNPFDFTTRWTDLRDRGMLIGGSIQTPITGSDFVSAGLSTGPHMSWLMAETERLWLEGRLDTEQQRRDWIAENTQN
jgi:hypothetical protein